MVKKGEELIPGKMRWKPEEQWPWMRARTFHPQQRKENRKCEHLGKCNNDVPKTCDVRTFIETLFIISKNKK